MKKLPFLILTPSALVWLWLGCADEKNPLPSVSHPNDWAEMSVQDNHGAKVMEAGLVACAECHGKDYRGGASKVSCFKCHASYPHDQNWLASGSDRSHGNYLAAQNWSMTACQKCHGADLSGGPGKEPCTKCHSQYPHANGWIQAGAGSFHGAWLKNNNWQLNLCANCHGPDYTAGDGKKSCGRCHDSYPHSQGWTAAGAPAFHGRYISGNKWSLEECKTCHGADYRGGVSDKSCRTCHAGAEGPETCNLCHGSAVNNAPPKGLNGASAVTDMGVGRHQYHVSERVYSCELCHVTPQQFNSPGHIDAVANAEVLGLWKWDRTNGTCTTGCHANNPGLNYVWNHP